MKRKNQDYVRINMAFTSDNHEYMRIMSRATGMSMTDFVNTALSQHRDDHQEFYNQAKEFVAKIDDTPNKGL